MKTKPTNNQKTFQHLSLSERIIIEQSLNDNLSIRQIALQLDKSASSISREIKKRRCYKGRRSPKTYPRCTKYAECTKHGLCHDIRCYKYQCRSCTECKKVCPEYDPGICPRLAQAPYVCNGCDKLRVCTYERLIYVAQYADDVYHNILSGCREGINQTPEKLQEIDLLISPLIKQGQSIAHIYATHAKELDCSRTTLYSYIEKNVLSVRNIDLPRKVKYKPRKTPTKYTETENSSFRIGRTYEDFCQFVARNPNVPVVEMDTVIGKKESHKVLLTLLFRNCSLMLIILLPNKSQEAVIAALNWLCERMGIEHFKRLFPVILTDNGAEFQFPEAIESDINGEQKTHVFYCHPNCSWEKGMIEKNHEFIRYVLPKGTSFDGFTQEDITVMTNHINSYARDSLNGCTPYKISRYILDNAIHEAMNLEEIQPDDVILKPSLLKK